MEILQFGLGRLLPICIWFRIQTGVSMPCIAQRSRPWLLQGSLTTFRRRCGKPACRCATGEPHESLALRFTQDGPTKTVTLTAADVAEVTAALARYEQAKANLDAQAADGIARLRSSRATGGSTRR
jgi:hypothetical protein